VAQVEIPRPVANPRPEVGASLKGTRPSKLQDRMVQKKVVAHMPTLARSSEAAITEGSRRLSTAEDALS